MPKKTENDNDGAILMQIIIQLSALTRERRTKILASLATWFQGDAKEV